MNCDFLNVDYVFGHEPLFHNIYLGILHLDRLDTIPSTVIFMGIGMIQFLNLYKQCSTNWTVNNMEPYVYYTDCSDLTIFWTVFLRSYILM